MKDLMLLLKLNGIPAWMKGLFILILSGVFINAQAQVQINENGGLESSELTVAEDTSGVEGWAFSLSGDAGAKFTVVNDAAVGKHALKISVDSLGTEAYHIEALHGPFLVEPGVTYTYSVWLKADSAGTTAHLTGGNPQYAEFLRFEQNETLTDTWQQFTTEFTVPAGDTLGRFPLHFGFTENVGSAIYVDNLTITKPHTNDNGSLEASDVTVGNDTTGIRGWLTSVDSGDATFRIVDDPVVDGNRALAVTVNETGENSWHIQAVNEMFDLIPGETYELSLYMSASEAGATAHITVGDPDYNEMFRLDTGINLGPTWQKFTNQFNVTAGDSLGRVPLHFSMADNAGKTIYIDSVRVRQLTGTPDELVDLPIVLEAEDAELGGEWQVSEDAEDGSSYISITTDYDETTGASAYPGDGRTASFQIDFPETGDYDLFARVRVGSDTFNDDSFFHGDGFGDKDPANGDDWFMVNGLGSAGFNSGGDVVRGPGGLEEGVWKWVNLSRNGFQNDTSLTFTVAGGLSKILEIGARENGLDIDKFVFGRSELFFTVELLNNGEAGLEEDPTEEPPVELEPIAAGKSKWLGNIYSSSQVEDFTNYWNQVTPENAGKWGSVEGTRDQMNWGGMDAAYALAKDNGFPIRFHILVWGGQQPGWINNLSSEEQLEEIKEWMDAVAEHYPDLDYVEVVNEGSNGHQLPDGQTGDADYIDALGGTGDSGHDWIITAFELARERFPNAKLMINDYGIVGNTAATSNYINIIEDLQERNLIDVIGVQSHAFSTRGSAGIMKRTLDMLAETGLKIQATEMDIDGNPNERDGMTEAESDQNQLSAIQRIFPVFWEHPSVEGVTMWGWRPGLWRQDQEAFLVRNNGEERPALQWLRAYVDTANVAVSSERLENNLPEQFELSQNYPNPFNPTTQIQYSIPKATDVSIKVYDITGRLVQTLVNNRQSAGTHTIRFNASSLSSGVYFYRIEAGSFTNVKRMMLIK